MTSSVISSVTQVCARARDAAGAMRELPAEAKDAVLAALADALGASAGRLKAANRLDTDAARAAGVSATLTDRLTLTDARIAAMIGAVRAVIALPDPAGQVVRGTVDVAALCLKSGNAAVLRGSSVAAHTNGAIADLIAEVLAGQDLVPADAVQLIRDNSRDAVIELLKADEYVDLLVPRGGPGLLATVREHATVPVVIDGDGNCHVYVDASADPQMATAIIVNAKTSRPSVCNAAETLLVHEGIAKRWLPEALGELRKLGVTVRGDERVREIWPGAEPATERDWATEYLDLVLAVRVVQSMDEALAHVARWGTRNSEAIVTGDLRAARRFARAVDTGSVFVNCSTRFSDGGEFGYGLEIGISTQKLHARGPMGLESLTCLKNVVWGDGQVRG